MLTRSRFQRGEGEIEAFDPEIGSRRRKKMASEDYREEDEKAFRKGFYQMADRVEKLFAYYQRILEKKEIKKEKAKDNASRKGEDPSDPSSPSSSSSKSSGIASSNPKKQPEKAKSDLCYLKLDIKFEFPTYNGELNT